MLKQISRNGHVYHHSATVQDLEKTHGQLKLKLIGINDASTLRLFCGEHDNNVFAPLEQQPFSGSKEQCFLLAYRALCHEYRKKKDGLDSIPTMKGFDRGKAIPEQVTIQTTMNALAVGYHASMRDIEQHKQQFDSMLVARDYSGIRAYIVTFDSVPDILCSGAIYPQCDFSGQKLQDLGDLSKQMELITFSLVATETGGAFVFAWNSSGDAICRPLAASLDQIPECDIPHALVRFVFEFCENHYLRPDWWDKADASVRGASTARHQTAASAWEQRSKSCLIDDGMRSVSWNVKKATWI
jgi:hypothetical protein